MSRTRLSVAIGIAGALALWVIGAPHSGTSPTPEAPVSYAVERSGGDPAPVPSGFPLAAAPSAPADGAQLSKPRVPTPDPGLRHWIGSAYEDCTSTWQLRQQEEQILAILADRQLDPARRREQEDQLEGFERKPVLQDAFTSQVIAGEGWSDHPGPRTLLAAQRACQWLMLPAQAG